MELMDQISREYEQKQMIRERMKQLVDDGELEIVGRLSGGEQIYRTTRQKSVGTRIWQTVRPYVAILPGLVAEYATGLMATLVVTLWGAVVKCVVKLPAQWRQSESGLLDFALRIERIVIWITETHDRLYLWRVSLIRRHTGHTWPSIRH